MTSNAIELVCREVVELVTEYLGGTLSPADRTRFDQHLATCPPCTAYLAQVKTTLELAAELGSAAPAPGDEVAQQLGDMFRRWHGEQKP
jgi:anti-sigma factor RsiW